MAVINLRKFELLEDLNALCRLIGQTNDLIKLRQYFVKANGLWAQIDRLTTDPPKSA